MRNKSQDKDSNELVKFADGASINSPKDIAINSTS